MKVILASQNQHKLVELSAILSQLGFEIALESEYGLHVDVDETGTTFEENSLLKAEAVMKASGLPVAERIEYLLSNLKDVPAEQRTAKFVCVITCLWPDGRKIVARGECPGQILLAPQGQGGFGYDPVFYLPELQKTYAELRPEEKNAISHRARALQAFCRIYREEFEHDDK